MRIFTQEDIDTFAATRRNADHRKESMLRAMSFCRFGPDVTTLDLDTGKTTREYRPTPTAEEANRWAENFVAAEDARRAQYGFSGEFTPRYVDIKHLEQEAGLVG